MPHEIMLINLNLFDLLLYFETYLSMDAVALVFDSFEFSCFALYIFVSNSTWVIEAYTRSLVLAALHCYEKCYQNRQVIILTL